MAKARWQIEAERLKITQGGGSMTSQVPVMNLQPKTNLPTASLALYYNVLDKIKNYIPDEKSDSEKYVKLSNMLADLNMREAADSLLTVSRQESQHKQVLEQILSQVKAKKQSEEST